jgi:hypothetical protein
MPLNETPPIGPKLLWLGAALAAFLVPLLRSSRSPAARTLSRNLFQNGPEPTAEENRQIAKLLLVTGISALIFGAAAIVVSEHWPINSPNRNLFSGIGLFFWFGGPYSLWHAFKRWRMSTKAVVAGPTAR